MYNKNLLLKYGFLFIFILIILAVIDFFKTSKIHALVQQEVDTVNQYYSSQLNITYDKVDLIFENIFAYNKSIHQLLESKITSKQRQEKFKQQFEKELNSFKAHSIKSINLYDVRVQDSIVLNVIEQYQSYQGFDFVNNILALRVIKPIFNEQMQILGAVEFILDIHHLLYQLNQHTPYTMRIIYNKSKLQTHLSDRQLKAYKPFEHNEAFVYKPSVYDAFEKVNSIYYYAFANDTITMQQMNQFQAFAKSFTFNDMMYDMVFLPLRHLSNEENLGFILSYHQNNHLSELLKNHKINLYTFCIIFFLLTIMAYTIHWLVLKKQIIQQEIDQLKMDIDKYVIMTETDKEGIIRYVSQAFCKISGYTKEDLLGRPQNIIRHPDISKTFFKNMWQQISNGQTWEGEIKNIDKNGNSYWIRGIIIPIKNRHQEITGYRSIRVNITDEKQLEKVNSILKDDLSMRFNEIKMTDKGKLDESKIELMGKMLDAFANEWKKPISQISLKSLDLETRLKTEIPSQEYLKTFTQDINMLIKLLSGNLNQFKYIFHNKNNEKYNVYNEVEHAIFSLEASEDISIHFQGDKELYTFGIAHDLKQIVQSLLNNAIEQFDIKNIKNGMISIDIYQQDKNIFVTIEDNALGIPEDIRKRIFEPDFSTKVDLPSKGLSLYMSKLMLQKNGGDLSVKAVNNGSCFILRLISKDRRKEHR